jgi:hypothetical protein
MSSSHQFNYNSADALNKAKNDKVSPMPKYHTMEAKFTHSRP